ncbi:hypothetical protein [Mesoterricola silvestris]|uniref:Uncharacterized protein n=1 Tax=Mesoterricola silvestris TaxID=2927979 RepID=A0AA48GV27_9BACT|nr:hypothetical protein [Mesoterricola silvestris]BDU72361.1 hypothetical protein METEAL_15350 [Mesoterricola silvestris]
MNHLELFATRCSILANEAAKLHDSLPHEVQLPFREGINQVLGGKSYFQAASRAMEEAQKKGAA